jgi:radical SAM superfamily enzyme YgiQ (UPF0313 family)
VKTGEDFSPRTQKNVFDQINELKEFYAQDLSNYNAIFLGQHDALGASPELLEFAASYAYEIFEFSRSYMKGAYLFLFGSVDSLVTAKDGLFEVLNGLPFLTYINVGLESADQETLTALGKPIASEMIGEAFARMFMNGGSMRGETRRTMLRRFGEIKSLSLLPTYLYLIQRL